MTTLADAVEHSRVMSDNNPAAIHPGVPSLCRCPVGPEVFGTFGELAQGYRRSSGGYLDHYLFSLPVWELSSRVADSDATPRTKAGIKSRTALTVLCQLLGVDRPQTVPELVSTIPVGKGHASSTADIVCLTSWAIERLAPHLGYAERKLLIAEVARRIESGDYLMHRGIASCQQRAHLMLTAYRTDLRWRIVGIDEGGEVETDKFHQFTVPDPNKAPRYESIFERLDRALREGDSARAASLATESALLHQDVLPKRTLNRMLGIADSSGAEGVCVAHSGTLVGLIFSGYGHRADAQLAAARSAIVAQVGLQPSTYSLVEENKVCAL